MDKINKEIENFIENFRSLLLKKCKKIIGIYLFGSLTYESFNEKTSDIDLVVITETFFEKMELENIKCIHKKLNEINEKWSKRLEVSYTPIYMLSTKNIPIIPRPYYNEIFYDEATYGNEWLINNYQLIKYGKTIFGPEYKTLIKFNITIGDIVECCINDFYKEWYPQIEINGYTSNSHCQVYTVLNICRIIYTILNSKTESKQNSAYWVKNKYDQWKNLIEKAEEWDYDKEINIQKEINEYIIYMDNIIKKYKQVERRITHD